MKKARERRKTLTKAVTFLISLSLVLPFVWGCSQNEPEYADDAAINAISEGLMNRWKYADRNEIDSKDYWKNLVNQEINAITPYIDKEYEDEELQTLIIEYLNYLNESLEIAENKDLGFDQYSEKWDELYDKRSEAIMQFANDYGLSVSENYQNELDKLAKNGEIITKDKTVRNALESLVDSIVFEKNSVSNGHLFVYSAVAENTTEYTIDNMEIKLILYDADNVRGRDSSIFAEQWKPREKIKLETASDVDAVEIKAELGSFEIAE